MTVIPPVDYRFVIRQLETVYSILEDRVLTIERNSSTVSIDRYLDEMESIQDQIQILAQWARELS